jgi:hypothetical protein
MDWQNEINEMLRKSRENSFSNSNQLTLGDLIDLLEPINALQKDRIETNQQEATVCYDFEYLFPTSIDSWRGSYAELALNWSASENRMKVSEFISMLNDAVGKTFEGYKGGEYLMSRDTPIWVANEGNSGNTGVIGVLNQGYQVILLTSYTEF